MAGLVFHKFSKLVYETMKTFAPMASYSSENFVSTSFFLFFILEKASPSLGFEPEWGLTRGGKAPSARFIFSAQGREQPMRSQWGLPGHLGVSNSTQTLLSELQPPPELLEGQVRQ